MNNTNFSRKDQRSNLLMTEVPFMEAALYYIGLFFRILRIGLLMSSSFLGVLIAIKYPYFFLATISFLITALAIGILDSYLTIRKSRKKEIFAAFILLPQTPMHYYYNFTNNIDTNQTTKLGTTIFLVSLFILMYLLYKFL